MSVEGCPVVVESQEYGSSFPQWEQINTLYSLVFPKLSNPTCYQNTAVVTNRYERPAVYQLLFCSVCFYKPVVNLHKKFVFGVLKVVIIEDYQQLSFGFDSVIIQGVHKITAACLRKILDKRYELTKWELTCCNLSFIDKFLAFLHPLLGPRSCVYCFSLFKDVVDSILTNFSVIALEFLCIFCAGLTLFGSLIFKR